MMMPYMDGEATIRALRKLNPEVRILAASGLTSNGKNFDLSEQGVKGFLTKPYTAEKLLRTLRDILA
jgi:DNA-binding response OmpR family regulator